MWKLALGVSLNGPSVVTGRKTEHVSADAGEEVDMGEVDMGVGGVEVLTSLISPGF